MIVALIPARGGSKRLPRKNIRMFAGQPLLYYSIAVARAVRQVDRCIVSTDDDEVASVATQCGAEVIRRPANLATDDSPTASAAQHVLRCLTETGDRPTAVLTLQPTCPLRPVGLVEEALERFESHEVDSVISVTRSHQKLGKIQSGCFVPDYVTGMRSQDMGPRYFENGLVYVTRADLVLHACDLFGRRILPLETDPLYSHGDIDTQVDFEIAECLYERYADRFRYASFPAQTLSD